MAQDPQQYKGLSLGKDVETIPLKNSSKSSTPTPDKKSRPPSTKASNRNSLQNADFNIVSSNKVDDLQQKLNDSRRENQILAAKLEKYEEDRKKKGQNLNKEKEMRLAANQERYWLKQQLDKIQMALEARLKLLGIDFGQCSNLSEALEAAFRAIQALSKELADKEAEIEKYKSENSKLQQAQSDVQNRMNNMENELKKQRKIIDDQRKNVYNKERQISSLGHQTDDLASERAKYETQMAKLRESIQHQKNKASEQFEDFANAKIKLEGELKNKEKTLESLQADLDEANEKNKELNDELDALRKKIADLTSQLARTNSDMSHLRQEAEAMEKEKNAEIDDLKSQLDAEKSENADLKAQIEELRKQIKDANETIAIQDDEINKHKKDAEKNKNLALELERSKKEKTSELTEQLGVANTEKEQLMDMCKNLKAERDEQKNEIADLKKQLEEANKKLKDYLDRPKDDKCVQTEIDMVQWNTIDVQLSDLAKIREETSTLRSENARLDSLVKTLHEENKVLLDDIDYLLKQQGKFRPDSTNHRGEVLALITSPSKYQAATCATDKTVKLWKINPKEEKEGEKVQAYAAAAIEGSALSLAFTKDGNFLAAGCSYKGGPEGIIMVWNTNGDSGEVQYLFRSRPSVRFGRATCICWSDDNRFIFSGDTTGAIWVWDTQNLAQLAEIAAHKDVVHSVDVSDGILFSCSLDQTLSSFNLKELSKIKFNKEKAHAWNPKKCKASSLYKNDKYPIWRVTSNSDASLIACASRKIEVFTYDKEKNVIDKGPRINDADVDHIKEMFIRKGMLCICRQETERCKIFDLQSGKEICVGQFKDPVTRIAFCFDLQNCLICVQSVENKKPKPPSLKLWQFQ